MYAEGGTARQFGAVLRVVCQKFIDECRRQGQAEKAKGGRRGRTFGLHTETERNTTQRDHETQARLASCLRGSIPATVRILPCFFWTLPLACAPFSLCDVSCRLAFGCQALLKLCCSCVRHFPLTIVLTSSLLASESDSRFWISDWPVNFICFLPLQFPSINHSFFPLKSHA